MWWLLIAHVFTLQMFVFLFARWRREGSLTEKRFAFMTAAFFSWVDLTGALVYSTHWRTIAIGTAVALFQFAITYPAALWIHRKLIT